jgi:hypothetical protein
MQALERPQATVQTENYCDTSGASGHDVDISLAQKNAGEMGEAGTVVRKNSGGGGGGSQH